MIQTWMAPFHVKHNLPSGSSTSQQEYSEIGAEVRLIVGKHLSCDFWRVERGTLLNRIERLAELVGWWGTRVNLTAEPHNSHELSFHILDSLAPLSLSVSDDRLLKSFGPESRILDLGTGAGFPGLILASASSANFTLLEGRRKRASFLSIAAAELGLANVAVRQSLPSAKFDVVTARAFARAPLFHSVASSVLRSGGVAILYANIGQDLALSEAANKELIDFRAVSYKVPRKAAVFERILAMWRRA